MLIFLMLPFKKKHGKTLRKPSPKILMCFFMLEHRNFLRNKNIHCVVFHSLKNLHFFKDLAATIFVKRDKLTSLFKKEQSKNFLPYLIL